ncbi:chorismate mutase [Chitinispirillales bacterium ANBcel5]|uniref:chorismate mutase n=1 Tax=Cellulosispirillum alkaliphilum TaxID=3039283 RepID=UPI002A58D76B|nr:chorismate mutase [Chitinispirillales bacterium ANBcel5]
MSTVQQLPYIASRLEGLEETIISKLIERAQWHTNPTAYQEGKSGFGNNEKRSLLELRLSYQEEMDALFGRFCVPEERPFTDLKYRPQRTVSLPESGLHIPDYQKVNLTKKIYTAYQFLLKHICTEGDDGQYGSSVEHDVYALQAISRRVHFGALYVAECKYRSAPNVYKKLIAKKDEKALLATLTRPEVEEKIIQRVQEKTRSLQQCANLESRKVIKPETVVDFYQKTIIPLTKEGEILYLLNRKQD